RGEHEQRRGPSLAGAGVHDSRDAAKGVQSRHARLRRRVRDASISLRRLGGPPKSPPMRMPARPFRHENAMSELPECLLIVTAEVDEKVEAEWNRWYDTVHFAGRAQMPGSAAWPAVCLRG